MKKRIGVGILIIILVILNLMVAFTVLSLKSDWAVGAFVANMILLIFIAYKITNKL